MRDLPQTGQQPAHAPMGVLLHGPAHPGDAPVTPAAEFVTVAREGAIGRTETYTR